MKNKLSLGLALLLCGSLLCPPRTAAGAVPSPEQLLPQDTLLMLTAPDFERLSRVCKNLPAVQCWRDPAMKPFRDKLLGKWQEQFVQPLERELGLKLNSYTELVQGQVTFAITQNGWTGKDDQSPGLILLLDSRQKSPLLKKALADLRKKWIDAGKSLRTEKIREYDFTLLPISTNDVPAAVRKLLPSSEPVQELGQENDSKKPSGKTELVIGQLDSLLVVADTLKAAEKVVMRYSGGPLPALAELDSYQADQAAFFRDAPLYGWVNAKALIDLFLKQAALKKDNPDAPNPFDLKPDKILSALGFASIKTIALSLQDGIDGELVRVFVGVPEAGRQGLFKILAGEPNETAPPPFVPADAVKFQRWRLDSQKAWATLEKMLNDISPQALGTLNFLLDSANANAKDKDSNFDIRKDLLGNLGNDLITYEKRPAEDTAATGSGPSLVLVGSPNAERLASSLKSILVFVAQQAGGAPAEREFLGRKIYSLKIGGMGLPMGGGTGALKPTSLSYAGSGGYLALSTDVALLEEYLRSSEAQTKPLRGTAGLAEAMQKVTGPGTSLFGYENEAETMRVLVEQLRKEPGSGTASDGNASASLGATGLSLAGAGAALKDWADFSLLPPFQQIAKYFGFSVYGGSATTEGLMLRLFDPMPPGLRTQAQR